MMGRTCRDCNDPIMWARTVHGNPMPLDPLPADNGNVLLEPVARGYLAHVLNEDERRREGRIHQLYVHHAVTCRARKAKPQPAAEQLQLTEGT